jgi:(1->4)-alpha-D-glucan 1-alpha-D-glucosylmutase
MAPSGLRCPAPNDEYLIYQTLIGAWPVAPMDAEQRSSFIDRVKAYVEKAAKEAKVYTSWTDPTPYSDGLKQFVEGILTPGSGQDFLTDFKPFQRRVSHLGHLNSLSQTVLRLAAPGVPDTYQGTELWDFSLVDPDNRRPVDYARRQHVFRALRTRAENQAEELARELIDAKEDGRVKLYVTWRGLTTRRDYPRLFTEGDYLAVTATGTRADHVFAFARRNGDRWALVIIPRLLARLTHDNQLPLGPMAWQTTRLMLPLPRGLDLRNVFTQEVLRADDELPMARALERFPVAMYVSE